ncbi:MAG: phosphatase PAP2 family protein [Prevotella sp.]|jgi:membrane-associated phospholipid phosphatase
MIHRILLTLFLFCSVLTSSAQTSEKSDGPDDILEYTPYVATVTLKLCGVETASSWKRLAVNGILSWGLTAGTTLALKHTIHSRRPDFSDNHSFPSGHSAIAFAGATILYKEYRHVSPWIGVAGYAVATYTAIDRVTRNKHHWFDVIAGAGLGIAGTEFGYWLGDKITGERSRYSVGVGPNGIALAINL